MGRLEFYVEPINIDLALSHFQKDLELSKIIGDYKGQVKMYSFIGACYIKNKQYDKATESYNM